MSQDKYEQAIELIDAANNEDPNQETAEGKEWSKELLYGHRMADMQERFQQALNYQVFWEPAIQKVVSSLVHWLVTKSHEDDEKRWKIFKPAQVSADGGIEFEFTPENVAKAAGFFVDSTTLPGEKVLAE